MKILLWTDDLMTRVRLDSAWTSAGATVLKKNSAEVPEIVVVDLGARDALGHIARLHAAHPGIEIVAFGPHFDADAFHAARAAGASEMAARSSIVERLTRKMRRPG